MPGKPDLTRVSTGIIALDEVLYGGIPRNNQNLVYGDPGTGKTLLTFEMLYRNAKLNVPTTYVTLEESRVNIGERQERIHLF